MKNKRLLAALGALVLCVATVVWGDYNVLNKSSYYQNATSGAKTNSTGDATVEISNSPQTFVVFQPGWMNATYLHRIGSGTPPAPYVMQDSVTVPADVRGANGLALAFYPTFDESTGAAAFAIQIRWHYSQVLDSTSTFIEAASRVFSLADAPTTATKRDSIGSFVYQAQAYGQQPDSLANPDEQVLVFTNKAGQNRGRLLRLTPPNAPSGSSAGPYLSVRIRHLNTYNVSGLAWGNGTNTVSEEPHTLMRVDLLGWR